jgi:thiamine pyrophosphate-dependent acetolactate synthase large subunit-like protein
MSMADLETAVRNELPLIIIAMNDSAYGSEWVHLRGDGMPVHYADLPTIDFAAVAASVGIESVVVSDRAGLEALGPLLRDRSAPLLVDCRIRRDLTAARLQWPR